MSFKTKLNNLEKELHKLWRILLVLSIGMSVVGLVINDINTINYGITLVMIMVISTLQIKFYDWIMNKKQ